MKREEIAAARARLEAALKIPWHIEQGVIRLPGRLPVWTWSVSGRSIYGQEECEAVTTIPDDLRKALDALDRALAIKTIISGTERTGFNRAIEIVRAAILGMTE